MRIDSVCIIPSLELGISVLKMKCNAMTILTLSLLLLGPLFSQGRRLNDHFINEALNRLEY